MALAAGTRLGAYEIVALIGAGGMGEVYRGRDTRLSRDVAIKVLPEAFTGDAERLARFKREAQVLASLNHPHIGAIYGLEETVNGNALVLELVDGPTLADRIAQGPISLEEAVPIALQIAEALEAAHERGIIHRDLKPTNIKLRTDGTVKVLDFGLAKGVEPIVVGDVSQSPTLSLAATRAGLILGTAAYMAPEQARGKSADKRADIWAFGAVLYELLSGRRAFDGEDASETLAAVLKSNPDWNVLPPSVTVGVRRVLARCLEKDPKQRLHDIADARIELQHVLKGGTETEAPPAIRKSSRRTVPIVSLVSAAAVVAVASAAIALWAGPRRVASETLRVSVDVGANVSLVVDDGPGAVLSPDARRIAFVGQSGPLERSRLFVRRLDEWHATPLPGTEGAANPFFSPDGRWIGFFAGRQLRKIPIGGGTASTLCDVGNSHGGAWSEDGTIIFNAANGAPLMRVSSAGGRCEPVGALVAEERLQRWPQVVQGGKAVLFTSHNSTINFDDANLVIQPLPSGPRTVVHRGGYAGRYLSSGHLLYASGGRLFAERFDLDRLQPTGPAVPIVDGVAASFFGGAQYSVSETGTLLYVSGQKENEAPVQWMDRQGKIATLRATLADWSNLTFSPDGQKLALDIGERGLPDVWVYEWQRDALIRLTTALQAEKPVWTPDGRRLVFSAPQGSGAPLNLYWQRVDGAGSVERLTDSQRNQLAGSFHPSGKWLAYFEQVTSGNNDLLILPFEGDEKSGWRPGKPYTFLSTHFSESEPSFSRDGQWLAYHSDESGREEVYVRPFPGPGGKWQVSTDGTAAVSATPTWSRTRNELFYPGPDQRLMVVAYTITDGSFRADKPRPVSDVRFAERRRHGFTRSYDVHPDADRFALAMDTDSDFKRNHVALILNFFEDLRQRTAAQGE
jgi:serine/threonine-protein kinase